MLAGLATVVAALAVALGGGRTRTPGSGPRQAAGDAPASWWPAPRSGTGGPDPEVCEGVPGLACVGGDVWRVDACGEPLARERECGAADCRKGACMAAPDTDPLTGNCVGVPDMGICDGDVARFCRGGQVAAVDCGARDLVCAQGAEGAECRPRDEERCAPSRTRPRCVGQTLVRCVDARVERTACLELGGRCMETGGEARCAAPVSAAPSLDAADCGPCGCIPEPADETCNGLDDDADGYVDEGVECGPVDVVAFIATDGGELAHDRAQIERAIARTNRVFSRRPGDMPADEGGGPLQFRLVDVVALDREAWAEISDAEFFELAAAPETHPRRDAFYVPVVFADRFALGEVPKSGASTLPHDVCGGARRGPGQLPVGVVVVGRERAPTTLAHELGHFLGLCHTHEADPPMVRDAGSEGAEVCGEACEREGDGLCDTPRDPGPPSCSTDEACAVRCEDGSSPEPANVMGYYPWCREGFSTDQLRTVRRSLAQRRAWHGCAGGACKCRPGRAGCPEGMGCYPFVPGSDGVRDGGAGGAIDWHCSLDGQVAAGGTCERHTACGAGMLCARAGGSGTCARACTPGAARCDCAEAFTDGATIVGICREDTG